MVAEKIA